MKKSTMWAVLSATCWLMAGAAAFAPLPSCTKQQGQALVAAGTQVAIDLCKEAPELLPPGSAAGLVALACQALEANAPAVLVLIDGAVLGTMKAQYIRERGALPKGYAK